MITEKQLQENVRQLALYYRGLYYHTHDSRRSPGGFPDAVIVKDNRLLIYELKSAAGKLSPEQEVWLKYLDRVNVIESGVWRPADWVSGEIERAIKGGRDKK